jgi:hypothetical protein
VKASQRSAPIFDDPNVVSVAGLVPALRLAESAGVHDLLGERLSVGSPNATAKTKTTGVVGGMLAGADCIDDLDLLRHGGMGCLFGGVRAPRHWRRSCVGSATVTFSSSMRLAAACWPDWPAGAAAGRRRRDE